MDNVKDMARDMDIIAGDRSAYRGAKQILDLVIALIASVILLLPMAIIALLIVIKDKGNPFYLHTRIGYKGEVIQTAKFRSMRIGADDLENMLTPEQLEEYRKEYKIEDDPRLIGYKKTGDGKRCFGAILRKCSLDELPQIPYNILLKRDMSFVGPRPVLREELDKYYTEEERKRLLSVKPGLTGYWQAYARNNAGYEDGKRQRMELFYVDNKSVAMDIKVLFKTVGTVVNRRGVS